jgi:hypothetical protein
MSLLPQRLIVPTLCLVGYLASVATADFSKGSIAIFADESCHESVLTDSPEIPLEKCLPATTSGEISLSFIVSEKPFCADGSRPDLLQFDDPCCINGIANWAPNALYGDYGNGSCQYWGGAGFRSMVFSCGEFELAHQPTVISLSVTFPAPPHSTISLPEQCPGSVFIAPSTTGGASAATFTGGIATTSFSPTSTTASAAAAATTSGTSRIEVVSAAMGSILFIVLLSAVVQLFKA